MSSFIESFSQGSRSISQGTSRQLLQLLPESPGVVRVYGDSCHSPPESQLESSEYPASPDAIDLLDDGIRQRYLQHRAELAASPPTRVWHRLFEKEMAFELAFSKAGGLLVAGSDPTGHGGVVAGFSNQREIELLVEAGFTPVEAIRVVTLNGARALGRDTEIGSIAKGKRADLVVIHGNPEDTISDITHVETVFRDGIGYDPAKIRASVKGVVGVR